MNRSDWIGGLALATFLSLPVGMIAALYASLFEKPKKFDVDAPLVSPQDVRRCAFAAVVFVALLTFPLALLFKADRQNAESWQTYTREHKCVVVDQRSHVEYRGGGYPGTSRSETITEYLWRCEGGDEHWHE